MITLITSFTGRLYWPKLMRQLAPFTKLAVHIVDWLFLTHFFYFDFFYNSYSYGYELKNHLWKINFLLKITWCTCTNFTSSFVSHISLITVQWTIFKIRACLFHKRNSGVGVITHRTTFAFNINRIHTIHFAVVRLKQITKKKNINLTILSYYW